jgi:hypothetical protein
MEVQANAYCVARSSMEAERFAADEAVQEAMHLFWLRYFLQGESSTIPMYTDSQCALSFTRNPVWRICESTLMSFSIVSESVRRLDTCSLVEYLGLRMSLMS